MQVAMFAEVIAHAIAIIKKHYGHHIPGREDGVLRASHRIGSAGLQQLRNRNRRKRRERNATR